MDAPPSDTTTHPPWQGTWWAQLIAFLVLPAVVLAPMFAAYDAVERETDPSWREAVALHIGSVLVAAAVGAYALWMPLRRKWLLVLAAGALAIVPMIFFVSITAPPDGPDSGYCCQGVADQGFFVTVAFALYAYPTVLILWLIAVVSKANDGKAAQAIIAALLMALAITVAVASLFGMLTAKSREADWVAYHAQEAAAPIGLMLALLLLTLAAWRRR